MKKKLLFAGLILSFFSLNLAYAQISEKEANMSLGPQNAFEMTIDCDNVDKVEKLWKNFGKDFGKYKKNRKSSELYGEEIKIKRVNGKDAFDAYIRVDEYGDQSRITFWFDMGDGFLSSDKNPEVYGKMMKLLSEFEMDAHKTLIEEELKAEGKMLTRYEKDLKQLHNENDRYHDQIEKAKETIAKMEENIDTNLKDQKDKQLEIEIQKESIQKVNDKMNDLGKNKSSM